MSWDVAGIGNALMDALVVLEDDRLVEELGLVRGTMHPVSHSRWTEVYERVRTIDPDPAKVPQIVFDSGGSCANAIATVGRLGGRATYCGQVGDDQMGKLYASLMERASVSHCIRFTKAAATGKCLSIISRKDAERTMLTDLGAAITLQDAGPFAEELKSTKIAFFEGYMLLEGPMRQVALEAMEIAHSAGVTVALDASDPFVVLQVRDLMWTLLERMVDVVFLNKEEVRALTGEDDPHVAAAQVAGRARLKTVAVKLGREGSVILRGGERFDIPVYPVSAIDTTGAGDAYAGGFLYALSQGWDPERAGKLASSVAAIAVSQVGAVVKDAHALERAVAALS